jgi:hypothetical protein
LGRKIVDLYDLDFVRERVQTGFISALDLDGTLTLGSLTGRKEVRSFIDTNGLLGFMSARTPELMMSKKAFKASQALGFNRPAPHATPFVDCDYLVDPAFMIGFGTQVMMRSGDGYVTIEPEKKYTVEMWRMGMLRLLISIDRGGDIISALSANEYEDRYLNGTANVFPLENRIALHFSGGDAALQKEGVERRIKEEMRKGVFVKGKLKTVDESDPEKERHTLYLIPPHASKEAGLDHVMRTLSRSTGVETSSMKLVIGGDTCTDLRAGCFSGLDSSATFILAGGSPIAPYFIHSEYGKFPGDTLVAIIRARLRATKRRGHLTLKIPGMRGRHFVIGDLAYPGLLGADSIQAYLESRHYH